MVKLLASTVSLICVILLAGAAMAQPTATATNTRRPTPVPTSTRTATVIAATPTRPAGGSDVFLCSSGSRDGATCVLDEDCPDGACVLTQGVCDGGSNDGNYCTATDDCDGGVCKAAQRVCLAGSAKGSSCLDDGDCPDSSCVSTGLFCDSGDFEDYSCIDDGGCDGEFEDGDCTAPPVFLCSGGNNDGASCVSNLDCPAGACVVSQSICNAGEAAGLDCLSDFDCPGGACTPTGRVCSAGENVSFGCLGNANCPGGVCSSTGKYCDGGEFDGVSCVDDDACTTDANEASCITPGQNFYCSGGANDGVGCSSDDDCTGGACVLSQGVCEGGGDDGDLCDTSADCDDGACIQTQKVCLAGDLEGAACLTDSHCGSGILCGPSGLFCSGGDFDGLSCVIDDNCCDEDGCGDTDENDGICVAPSVFLCSGGSRDNQSCESHIDCPSGACVEAQRVCDGGGDDFDGLTCQGPVNCGGASCVATSHICIRNGTDEGETIEVEGYGCLRDDHCFGAGAGSCMATAQVCDGGDTSSTDYDPFDLLISCTDDDICHTLLADDSLSCVNPSDRGFACSAGQDDGQHCDVASTSDCPDGACVLEDALCSGGSRAAQLCDSNADCPGGSCVPTWRVCSDSGFSCADASQCDNEETCISTGRVCENSDFGAFSCLDDSNCYNPDTPDEPSGACVGSTPRECSLDAPCLLNGVASGEVFGFAIDPLTSPATFDFYLVPIIDGAVGVSVVLRPIGDDVDIYAGRELDGSLQDPADYPLASNNSGESTDLIRVSPLSNPTYASFTAGLDEFGVAVVGLGGDPSYTLQAAYIGASNAGDATCDGTVNEADVDGLIDLPFDPAIDLTSSGSFSYCLGADGNADGAESAADLIAAIRHIGAP